MIARAAAERLIDFGKRIGDSDRANQQLEGAIAIHNILEKQGVAYLADEVGMGKTYVALGVLALFRHFNPNFRMLVIAPRENIQDKWIKELENFVANNIRFPDLRVKGIDGRPTRRIKKCNRLLDFLNEVLIDPDRDFFLRLSSFSLALEENSAEEQEQGRRLRDQLIAALPWLNYDLLDLRSKQGFKDNFGRALCCCMPVFDLVIVDEAHNLKHGLKSQAARNQVLSKTFGRDEEGINHRIFKTYGIRAKRLLLLSATPIEDNFRQLWNQLDVFGKGDAFHGLCDNSLPDSEKQSIIRKFLVRRVNSIQVGGTDLTRNLYRREWRNGGVENHDVPMVIEDPRQRLIVALVQKKVSELIGSERFNRSFQIGMLASFESFLQTTKVKREDQGTFDDVEQTDSQLEREGIDVAEVNALSRHYRREFQSEMPHPKMDQLVKSLAASFECGRKSLIFIRRVASVKEIKRKLDEAYDRWLMARLEKELRPELLPVFKEVVQIYESERLLSSGKEDITQPDAESEADDQGGTDTFFAWFFRGDRQLKVVSGANVQRRFIQQGSVYATFFKDNYVSALLGERPGRLEERLCQLLSWSRDKVRAEIRRRSQAFLPGKPERIHRFEAVQRATMELLRDEPNPHKEEAAIVWQECFAEESRTNRRGEAPDIEDWLELPTFFTELRERPELREAIWPHSKDKDARRAFQERELRRELLASTARLGHAFIDLYILTVNRLGSLAPRKEQERGRRAELERINAYLDLLESQRLGSGCRSSFRAFSELSEVSRNFDLILDVNAPEVTRTSSTETAIEFGKLLRQQQPVAGMSGSVNKTLVRQFRMPGYPFVLITTDLLQEGEDLHTFCSEIYHYGISWTPSSMEQRIGRVDRVRSLAHRRLTSLTEELEESQKLQVYFPHLSDTVEVLQVRRVLQKMNEFMRLMHEGLAIKEEQDKRIDTPRAFLEAEVEISRLQEPLHSAFNVDPKMLKGTARRLKATEREGEILLERFNALRVQLPGLKISWEEPLKEGALFGTVWLGQRQQPFVMHLHSLNTRPLVHCISPIGNVFGLRDQEEIAQYLQEPGTRVGAILEQDGSYDLSIEGDVLLGKEPPCDIERVAELISRVTRQADEFERLLLEEDAPIQKFVADLTKEVVHEY